jgi:regulator-associated protein of mTOR
VDDGGGAGGGGAGAGGESAPPPLLASFRAFPEMTAPPPPAGATSAGDPGSGSGGPAAGLVAHFLPGRSQLVVGGGRAPYVRLWDVAAERCTAVLPLSGGGGTTGGGPGAVGYATSLSSPWPGTSLLIVGTSRGAIQVLDTRLARPGDAAAGGGGGGSCVAASLREHSTWVVNAAQPRSGCVHSLVSGSLLADVRFWDLRHPTASVHAVAAHRSAMTALAVHDFAPLVATGTRKAGARLLSNAGDAIGDLTHHEGFLGQRIGPVSTLAFHPYRLHLAVGALDSLVAIYGGAAGGDGDADGGGM